MESIISALIAGGLALVGVIITNLSGNKQIEQKIITAQAVTDTKLDALRDEVKKHNDFASRIPVIETRLNVLEKEVEAIKI